MFEPSRTSPLDTFSPAPGAPASWRSARVALCEQRCTGKLLLCPEPQDREALHGLPALWIMPDRCLVVVQSGKERALLARLLESMAGTVADVTDGLVGFMLTGPKAAELIACGCPLDLDRLPVSACTQTLLARVTVVLVRETETAFVLYVDASLAKYLWLWLVDAAAEFA